MKLIVLNKLILIKNTPALQMGAGKEYLQAIPALQMEAGKEIAPYLFYVIIIILFMLYTVKQRFTRDIKVKPFRRNILNKLIKV